MNEQPSPQTSDYQRPQQTWVCGRDCDACALGPSRFGHCRERDSSCQPRLSLRGQRTRFVLVCTVVTLAALLIGSWQTWRNEFVSPGPLTSAHQQASHEFSASGSCEACHDPGAGDLLSWLKTGQQQRTLESQSSRCLQCHEASFAAGQALAAHNIAPQQLAKLTQSKETQPFAMGDVLRVKLTAKTDLACATCHHEHQGAKIDLTTMTNRQCQACHQTYVHRFEENHPEFRFAGRSRTKIAFDHAAHIQKHFPSKQRELQCAACHVDDIDRNVKLLANFEQTCAQCHQQPIQAATTDGLVAFAVPTLDVAKLKSAGLEIGSWPSAADGDFDGSLSALTIALLQADDAAAEVFARLGYDFDFGHVPTATGEELALIAELAWAYKQLLHELAEHPAETLRMRLEKTAGRALSSREWDAMARLVPPALFREAERRWFPQMQQDLAQHEELRTKRNVLLLESQVYRNEKPSANQELLAENPLAKRMQPVAKPAEIPGVTWWNQEEAKSLRTESGEKPAEPKSSVGEAKKVGAGVEKGVLLAENPLRALLMKPVEQSVAAPSALSAEIETTPVKPAIVVDEPQAIFNPPAVAQRMEVASDAIDLVANGAWFIEEATLSVRYRPRGHADEWLKLLLEVTSASTTTLHSHNNALFAKTLSEMGTKSCASCHSIDRVGEAYQVNWKSSPRDVSVRGFTNFSHRPHTMQPQLKNCTHCHTLNATAQVIKNYDSTITTRIVADFHPLQKSACVDCHASSSEGGRCTLCHSYHVGAKKHDK